MASRLSSRRRLFGLVAIAGGGYAISAAYMAFTGNEKFYAQCIMPLLRSIDAETAHKLAVNYSALGMVPRPKLKHYPNLSVKIFGIDFDSPIGLAAGFDKDAKALPGLPKLGFSFAEIGSVTPLPQPGNDKPRIFRLLEDRAIINRYGFNSDGAEVVLERLKSFRTGATSWLDRNFLNVNFFSPNLAEAPSSTKSFTVGVNIGKNKLSTDSIGDFLSGIAKFEQIADFLVINLSSPNTPGLRDLQSQNELEKLLKAVDNLLAKQPKRPKILIKLAPDLSSAELAAISKTLLKWQSSVVSGVIMGNTTVSRPVSLKSPHSKEVGGLSGEPLRDLATEKIAELYKLTGGRLPIVGVGGISNGKDAYEKIAAGASLLELYSALIYEGPLVVERIKRELSDEVAKHGFKSISEAVGSRSRKS